VSTLRRKSLSLGLILPFVAALSLAAPAAQASTHTGTTHHKSSKTHHASSGHKSKSHKKSTATG
jgi:hypothetical protein